MKQVTMHNSLNGLEEEGLFDSGVQRHMSDEELASYAQLAPELAPVFEAMIGNHDEWALAQPEGLAAMRAAGW